VIQVLIDRGDDHPVGGAAAFLPARVLQRLLREHERIRMHARKRPHLDFRFAAEVLERPIGRTVVEHDEAVHQAIVVTEEEPEDANLVPAYRIEVNRHAAVCTGPDD